ncbi:UNVERIFIED_CONTAM: hypothetical protein K2H54_049320 [Gekko kuhli]
MRRDLPGCCGSDAAGGSGAARDGALLAPAPTFWPLLPSASAQGPVFTCPRLPSQADVSELQTLEINSRERILILESQVRHLNVKFRGIPEGEEKKGDLVSFMMSWLSHVFNLENGVAPLILKAYRLGLATNPNRREPRDVLVQFADSRTCQRIIKEATSKGSLPYKACHVQVFPEVPQEALKIQKALKDTTSRLQQENIRYRWMASEGLQVSYKGSTLQATDEETGRALLEALKISEPMDTSGCSGKRRHVSPGSPTRSSKVSSRDSSSLWETASAT